MRSETSRRVYAPPFGGLWSNEYLNEKPQNLTVEGYLRGSTYIPQRNKLIEALRVPTDDDHPGYIDLPFWGRFPVVVGDNYEVSESADEQGQCAISIPFIRAGVSIAERLNESAAGAQAGKTEERRNEPDGKARAEKTEERRNEPADKARVEKAVENAETAAIDDFEASLADDKLDKVTLAAAWGQVKSALLGILGRIQGAKTVLNTITGEILGFLNFYDQTVRASGELARAVFNAGASIFGGLLTIKNSAVYYNRENSAASSKPSLPRPDNEKIALICFLLADTDTFSGSLNDSGDSGGPDDSGGSGDSDGSAGLVRQEATKKAVENLYRTMAFLVSARIITNMDSLTYKKAEGYWRLLEKLERSIDQENPAVYTAIQDVHTALSKELSHRELSREMTRDIAAAAPLLYLAYYLGCDEDKLRELNRVADSFIVEGDVIYV